MSNLQCAPCLNLNIRDEEQFPGFALPQRRPGLRNLLKLWHARATQRRQLRVLAEEAILLKDMGLSNYDALQESRKYFWQE